MPPKLNFKLPKFNFKNLDARSRMFVLLAAVVGVLFIAYLGTRFLLGGESVTGPSRVANAPAGLKSIPGGKNVPEYDRALEQQNAQRAQQAQLSGGSAIPTLMNTSQISSQAGVGQCTIICPEETANVKYSLESWVSQGAVSPDVASELQQLAEKNILVDDYAENLDNLVRQNKLRPEQAREVLDRYQKQHAGVLLEQSAKVMDPLIKSGELPLDVANQLLTAQKNNVSPARYADQLNQIVATEKITPKLAQDLLGQYTQQKAQEATQQGVTQLKKLTAAGQLIPEVEKTLVDLQVKNVPVNEYAAKLTEFVNAGKLIPATSNKLLQQYQEQKSNLGPAQTTNQLVDTAAQEVVADIDDSATAALDEVAAASVNDAVVVGINELAQNGQIPENTVAQLTAAAKSDLPVEAYEAAINQLTEQKQLTGDQAKALVANYQAVAALKTAARSNVPVEAYQAAVQQQVTQGKITPAIAKKLVDDYQVAAPLKNVVKSSVPMEAYQAAVQQQVTQGKITPEMAKKLVNDYQVATQLKDAIKNNVPLEAYQTGLNQLVDQGRLTPDKAKKLMADYQQLKGIKNVAQNLNALQANNAPVAAFVEALKQGVQTGVLSPDQATHLLQAYKAATVPVSLTPQNTSSTNGAAPSDDYAELKKRIEQSEQSGQPEALAQTPAAQEDFSNIQVQTTQQAQQAHQQDLQGIIGAMSGQAQQLIASWQPTPMNHVEGTPPLEKTISETEKTTATETNQEAKTPAGPTLIKAGTILFAVLDTAVNSDYPDTPVMVTIVDGKFKGAKLLGKLTLAVNSVGQQDKVGLVFSLMNTDDWETGKSVNAFAIDPDTARTVMASNVNYHYLTRFGAIMATSFVQGYANAILNTGTSTTGIFGTSTSHPELSAGSKIAVGAGQVGQTIGASVQNYASIPPTVVVDSGVGLGILFMSDVS